MKNIYIMFSSIFIILSVIVLGSINIINSNMVSKNPQLSNELNKILIIVVIFIFLTTILVAMLVITLRKDIVRFSHELSNIIDKVITGDKSMDFYCNKETLTSKVQNKLKQLVDMLEFKNRKYIEEKDIIKSLISDISHQIKTPIANISMYNETLIERELDRQRQKEFLECMKEQVFKLEWLVRSLIDMSRLETGIISLDKKEGNIKDTIANAIGGVFMKAQDKKIDITIECPDDIVLYHDKKWTVEGIGNIIDNSIKYSQSESEIRILVEKWELFTKIDIEDTGIGISKKDINNVFKRFYRAEEVNELDGIGIGLYISKEIIEKQGGYIKIKSEKNIGTTMSIFLLN